jgi:amphi-Trp domain-containing protein
MSDVKVEHKVTLTRQEAAAWIAELADALGGDGPVTIKLARSTVELRVPDHVRCEAEVEIEAGEVELEFELKWSMPPAG